MKRRWIGMVMSAWVVLTGVGCDEGGEVSSTGCSQDDSGGPIEVAPIVVDCLLSYAQGPVQSMTVTPGADDAGLVEQQFGNIVFEMLLSDDENAGRSLTVRARDSEDQLLVSTLFQMDRHRLPSNEFHGLHGFTGLYFVRDRVAGETLQFACFARDPSEPMASWE